jgi:hypothetical protein
MRTLITLSVLQSLGILVLIIYFVGREDRIEPQQRLQNPATTASPAPMRAAGDGTSLLADEERLRNVIRQELAKLQAQPNAHSGPSPPVVARPRNESADRYRLEQIAQQIDAYRAAGSISEQQMQELQAGIAQLDAASRKQMMSKLIRALNSGDLKGRL